MTPIIIIALAIQGMVIGLFSAFIAKSKNRNMVGWFYLGFLFSVVALIALVGVPVLTQSEITAGRRKSYIIIGFWVAFIVFGTSVTYAWLNLYLPDSVYEMFPAPAYRLKTLEDKFQISYQQLQFSYKQMSDDGKSSNVDQQIALIDETIDTISMIDGLDVETKMAHIASLSKLKFTCLELKNLLNQRYRY